MCFQETSGELTCNQDWLMKMEILTFWKNLCIYLLIRLLQILCLENGGDKEGDWVKYCWFTLECSKEGHLLMILSWIIGEIYQKCSWLTYSCTLVKVWDIILPICHLSFKARFCYRFYQKYFKQEVILKRFFYPYLSGVFNAYTSK